MAPIDMVLVLPITIGFRNMEIGYFQKDIDKIAKNL